MRIRNANHEHKQAMSAQDRMALKITKFVGSMWCAYIFAILAAISLPNAIAGGTATFIPWIAQTFLQLVLLSIIMNGQRLDQMHSETRAEIEFETSLKSERENRLIIQQNQVIIDKLNKLTHDDTTAHTQLRSASENL